MDPNLPEVLVQLENLFFDPPYEILIAQCDVVDDSADDQGDYSQVLFNLFANRGTLRTLLLFLIKKEISETRDETTIFRRNTITTKLLTLYTNSYGLPFIKQILGPALSKVEEMKVADYEVVGIKSSKLSHYISKNN